MKGNPRKRVATMDAVRLAVQIVSFILLPGLFVEAFAGLHVIGLAVAGQVAVDATFWMQVLATILTLVATALVGRAFCGWMCAFGTMEDLLAMLGKKVFKVSVRVDGTADRVLKSLKYVILALIVGFVWTGLVAVPEAWSPWEAFAGLLTLPPDFAGVASAYLVGLILLGVIMVASVFVERAFCRYLCPMGAVFGIVSLLRVGRIKKPRSGCAGKCQACTKSCAMGIDLRGLDEVRSPECIDCMRCTAVCPQANASYAALPNAAGPVVAGAAVAGVMGLYYVGNIGLTAVANATASAATPLTVASRVTASDTTASTTTAAATTVAATTTSSSAAAATTTTSTGTSTSGSSSSTSTTSSSAATTTTTTTASGYADGTYTGSGHGHKGTTTVQVVVSGGKITSITTVSTGDDAQYYNRAFSTVVSEIISSQSTSVNAVSGATHSSDGIMAAVASALASA